MDLTLDEASTRVMLDALTISRALAAFLRSLTGRVREGV
jgi:hypothetical protein